MSLKHALAATELYLQHNENPLLKRGLDIKELAKPMTNGDRIRAMTDEELAKVLGFFTHINECLNPGCGRCGACKVREFCEMQPGQELEWLQQPVKEDAE